MRWIWDGSKARSNRLKHRLSFETAQLVFDDPLAQSKPDPAADEERWLTLGLVGDVAIVAFTRGPMPMTTAEQGASSARAGDRRGKAQAYEEGGF